MVAPRAHLIIAAALTLACFGVPVRATVAPPVPPPHEPLESVAIVVSAASGFLNIALMASESPSYVAGGIGVGVGVGTMLLTTLEDNEHPLGLMASGASALVAGLISMRVRHVLDEQTSLRLEPTWRPVAGGSRAVGLAVGIDF